MQTGNRSHGQVDCLTSQEGCSSGRGPPKALRQRRKRAPIPAARSAACPIEPDALIRNPGTYWRLAGLPEHVDRHSATRIEIPADTQPTRGEQLVQALADGD